MELLGSSGFRFQTVIAYRIRRLWEHQASLGMWIAFPQISPSCGLEELRFLGAKVPRNRRIKDAFVWFAR